MSVNIFSKTWVNDYPWLKLAMTSVLKLCSEEELNWTIVGDPGSRSDLQKVAAQATQAAKKILNNLRIVEVQEHWPECRGISNNYLGQQWIKMNAHRVMDDKLFLNWDSDVIAIKPFSSETFMGKSGRPIYWFSQFNSLMNGSDRPAHEQRMQMMREIFGFQKISFEWMRCMPIWLNGQILRHASTQEEWYKSFAMMERNDHRISEFNIIGQFCHLYYPDAFEWKNAEGQGPGWAGGYVEGGVGSGQFQEHAIVAQGWSWNGVPPHIQAFVDAL